MSKHQVSDVRNVALVGHGAVGKTTLADLLLFKAGVATRAGSVTDGTSLLDTEDEERQHKYTITSSLVHFDHGGKRINLIDTPGYPDFIGQVISALRAVETAVVTLSATSGIEVNTRRCFAKAGDAGIGRMIVVNKCDLDNIRYDELLDSIRETFGAACIPLNVPAGLGHDFTSVISTLTPPTQVPSTCPDDAEGEHQALMDAIVEADEALMEKFFEGTPLTQEQVRAGLSKAVAAGTLIPVLFCSARTGVGVSELLDALTLRAPIACCGRVGDLVASR